MIKVLTQNLVRKLFNYDPETGILTWKVSRTNSIKIGDIAGCINGDGYLQTGISGKSYRNHRIAYLHYHGHLPEFVDHKDAIKTHNWISNLRKCSKSQNGQNSKLSKNNTSGVKGVCWCKRNNKWLAVLNIDGKGQYLGLFKDLLEASSSIQAARKKHHGEFACHK